jgi:hypothetical protein
MPEAGHNRSASSPSAASALVLYGPETTLEHRNLTRLLDFFAVPWKSVKVSDVNLGECEERYAVITTAACLAQVIQEAGAVLPFWLAKASSVYVYSFQDDNGSTKLIRLLTGEGQARVRSVPTGEHIMTITDDLPQMCGPMSGLRVSATVQQRGFVCERDRGGEAFQSVIWTDQGELFFGVRYRGVSFYLNTWRSTVDIGASASLYFDVRQSFCEAVPIVFYLTWMFRGPSSSSAEINACLIVDDPPLKRRYGFLDFREALELMDRHKFSTTIAFIPWNWRRNDPDTVRLFQSYPDKLSLVIHGCDHTASEFATRSPAVLNAKIRTSIERMELFQRRAEIAADRVMVFPQGVFSPETGRALKLNGFLAAVNTEVAPSEAAANETMVADLWNVAIMRYGTFPIFTRRYVNHGIENFAFDALLGKPCLIASHHEVFKDNARNLMDFVGHLNALKWNLVWQPLGDLVRRSPTVRRLRDGTRVLRMFACNSVIETADAETQRTLLLKEESDPDCIEAVLVNETPVEFNVEGGCLQIWLTPVPGKVSAVRVIYHNSFEPVATRNSSGIRVKIAANRYLSELRDNYLSRSAFFYHSATKLKRLLVS